MFEKVIKRTGNRFFPIEEKEINDAQEGLGIVLPKELKEFYQQVGYGFLLSDKYRFNCIMSPKELCEFRFRNGKYSNDTELEIYKDYEREGIVFFEICEGNYLSIGFSKNNKGNIFYGEVKIADTLIEFLEKYQKDENYFDL